jgi:hypothetical protein
MLNKLILCALLLVQQPGQPVIGDATPPLPSPAEVFTVAANPHVPPGVRPYFTPKSLLEQLPNFKPGKPEIKSGGKRWWQSGVIVLENKEVLFWRTCRSNFILVTTPDRGDYYYILGDGKADS